MRATSPRRRGGLRAGHRLEGTPRGVVRQETPEVLRSFTPGHGVCPVCGAHVKLRAFHLVWRELTREDVAEGGHVARLRAHRWGGLPSGQGKVVGPTAKCLGTYRAPAGIVQDDGTVS